MKHESIHFNHEVVYYVPCYQTNDGGYPTFRYSMSEATEDIQMAQSFNPDYILELKGVFDAKTQPYDKTITDYNRGIK